MPAKKASASAILDRQTLVSTLESGLDITDCLQGETSSVSIVTEHLTPFPGCKLGTLSELRASYSRVCSNDPCLPAETSLNTLMWRYRSQVTTVISWALIGHMGQD